MIVMIIIMLSSLLYAQDCTYSYTVWNTRERTSDGPFLIKKSRSQLVSYEKGPRGCTPCEEDQVSVQLSNGLSFKTCKHFASDFKQALEMVLSSGRKIESILSYRASLSKGKADARGRRTEFSHHAFGAALDVNENHNGLYNNCLRWSGQCVLSKGGVYRPDSALAIRENDEFVTQMQRIGLKWGGKIAGNQKDFMHFSLDGY